MLFADGALGLVLLGLWIFCIIDVITTDESQMRNLPKMVWLLIVLLLPDLGSILWLVAGRDWQASGQPRGHLATNAAFPEYDRPGRFAATNPDDDEEFLRGVRERAEQQRRRYDAQRRAELEAEQARLLKKPDED
jgi:phospholipase D-like protein